LQNLHFSCQFRPARETHVSDHSLHCSHLPTRIGPTSSPFLHPTPKSSGLRLRERSE
ncbi:unnamed protein product, partial [Musa hybrid cultivar]